MEKSLTLKAEIREHTGSKTVRRLRSKGRIPAVVYGHKKEPVAVSLDAHNFTEGLHHGHRLMDIQIGGKKEKIIIKDLQYDYLGKNVIHADLMRVSMSESVRVTVPIELKGIAQGTHEGGIIEEHTDHLEVECKVTSIPETIVVVIKDLGVGQVIHAGQVELPAGVKLISSPELLLVSCHTVAAAKTAEEVEEEEPAAPEVIGEAEEPEEGAEEQEK
jgi:large subunit ribosomal protein L25